ncbi:unnamed protein product, partial [marine sediment metagenome]
NNNSISSISGVSNDYNGIILFSSKVNIIENNSISSNVDGNGIYLNEFSGLNKIYHNNFLNLFNTSHDKSINFWDDGYPSGGNYWSGHVCIGNPSNGSSPFSIPGGTNIDHYPFMNPNGWLLPSIPNSVFVKEDYSSSDLGWQYDHFDVIQDGIDAVDENGTVYVFNGTYYENVIVNKSIDLIGEDGFNTIIDGGGVGDVVYVSADNVNISNFKIQHSGNVPGRAGLEVNNADGCTISYNNISEVYRGLEVWYISNNNKIIGNNI